MLLRKLLKNTTAQFVGKTITALLSFLTTILLASFLGAAHYGEYTKAISYILFFYILADFGLNAIFVRSAHGSAARARHDLPLFAGLRLTWGLVLVLCAGVGMWLLTFVNPGFSPLVWKLTLLTAPAILWYSLFLTANAVFQVELTFVRSSLALISGTATTLLMIVVLTQLMRVSPEMLVLGAGFAFALGALASLLAASWLLRRMQRWLILDFSFKKWRPLFVSAAPLGFVLFFNLIYFRIDTLLLTFWRPSSEIGAYGYAYKFFEFIITIPTFVMNSAFPLLSKLNTHSLVFRQTFSKLLGWLALSAVGVLLVGWTLAPLVVIRVDFSASLLYLRLLLIAAPLFFITSPLMWLFVLLKKQHWLMFLYLAGMVFNIVANYLWIPVYGAIASALITGFTELFVLVGGVLLLLLRHRLEK